MEKPKTPSKRKRRRLNPLYSNGIVYSISCQRENNNGWTFLCCFSFDFFSLCYAPVFVVLCTLYRWRAEIEKDYIFRRWNKQNPNESLSKNVLRRNLGFSILFSFHHGARNSNWKGEFNETYSHIINSIFVINQKYLFCGECIWVPLIKSHFQ